MLICCYSIVTTSSLVNQNVGLVIGGKAKLTVFVELCLYIASSEIFSVLLAAHIIPREVSFRRHTSVYDALSLSLSLAHACKQSRGRTVAAVAVLSDRACLQTRAARCPTLPISHVRVPVVTVRNDFGARIFGRGESLPLCPLTLSLSRSCCSATNLFSATSRRGQCQPSLRLGLRPGRIASSANRIRIE